MKIQDIIDIIEQTAPLRYQEEYDNSGLIIGDSSEECTGVLTCLDVYPTTLTEAREKGCNMIVSHHPFIFRGIKKLVAGDEVTDIITLAIRYNIAVYASHTCMDSSVNGVNDVLATQLGLTHIGPLDNSKYPEDDNYLGIGCIGVLPSSVTAKQFLAMVKSRLDLPFLRYAGCEDTLVKRIGLCSGSGGSFIRTAIDRGCDVFITADLKYHDFLSYCGHITLADIGHYESESLIKRRFIDIISKKVRNFATIIESEERNRIKFL